MKRTSAIGDAVRAWKLPRDARQRRVQVVHAYPWHWREPTPARPCSVDTSFHHGHFLASHDLLGLHSPCESHYFLHTTRNRRHLTCMQGSIAHELFQHAASHHERPVTVTCTEDVHATR